MDFNDQWGNAHRAHVDASGRIIIPGEGTKEEKTTQPRVEQKTPWNPVLKSAAVWEVTENDAIVQEARRNETVAERCENVVSVLKTIRGGIIETTKEMADESMRQYAYSANDMRSALTNMRSGLRSSAGSFLNLLKQPVWISRGKKPAKEYKRGTLFFLDVVQFGGTFAVIFAGLFVALNYQSFWQIASSRFDPVERLSAEQGTQSEIDSALREKLLRSPALATAGDDEGSLLSFLPEVGPPDNRLIIPALGLNVPLTAPSIDALLREDWEGVESDIQEALQGGVVHYPGTARPGQAGNFFVTGHSSYYPWAPGEYKTVFARLHELNVGDEYWVYFGGDKHRYIIEGKKEVKPSDVTVLDQPTNKRLGTLMTCTPVGTTLRRLIITAKEVDPITGIALEVGQKEQKRSTTPRPEALPI